MVVYVALVVRALRSPVDVDCACFGSLGGDRVTGATVWRNIWLATVAAVALWAALEGRSVVTRIAALSPSEAWWLVALAAAGLTVALVLGTAASRAQPSSDLSLDEGELEDYVRTPTPAVPVLLADGSETDLRALSRQRAQLLLFVSETCGSCSSVIEAAPTWRAALPQLDVRLVVGQPPESSSLTSTEHPQSVHDPRRSVRESFVIAGTPAALLLGVDGYLAGGPVAGSADVSQFIAEIQHELEGASEAS